MGLRISRVAEPAAARGRARPRPSHARPPRGRRPPCGSPRRAAPAAPGPWRGSASSVSTFVSSPAAPPGESRPWAGALASARGSRGPVELGLEALDLGPRLGDLLRAVAAGHLLVRRRARRARRPRRPRARPRSRARRAARSPDPPRPVALDDDDLLEAPLDERGHLDGVVAGQLHPAGGAEAGAREHAPTCLTSRTRATSTVGRARLPISEPP